MINVLDIGLHLGLLLSRFLETGDQALIGVYARLKVLPLEQ